MHTKMKIIFLLLIFYLFTTATSLSRVATRPQRCHPNDKNALLKIKSHFHNATLFSTWNPNTDCCKWRIVLCKKLPKSTIHRVNFLEIDGANDVVGTIPPYVSELPYLETLIFRNLPNLTGPVPPAIAQLTNLNFLLLNWNSLTGPIPAHFSGLTKLATLGLNDNHFTGPIPLYLAQLPNLVGLDLTNNKLTGQIPPTFGSFRSGASVQLSNNLLSGPIPSSLGRVNFSSFEAAGNFLTGDASFLFGKEKSELGHIDLSRNRLEFDFGKVVMPVGGEMESGLSMLDLSHNMIYGRLPAWLGKVPRLFVVNLSYNRLCGPIEGKLQGFDKSSFEHNLCLCDAPLAPCKHLKQ